MKTRRQTQPTKKMKNKLFSLTLAALTVISMAGATQVKAQFYKRAKPELTILQYKAICVLKNKPIIRFEPYMESGVVGTYIPNERLNVHTVVINDLDEIWMQTSQRGSFYINSASLDCSAKKD
jgi:hypothetical protein